MNRMDSMSIHMPFTPAWRWPSSGLVLSYPSGRFNPA